MQATAEQSCSVLEVDLVDWAMHCNCKCWVLICGEIYNYTNFQCC